MLESEILNLKSPKGVAGASATPQSLSSILDRRIRQPDDSSVDVDIPGRMKLGHNHRDHIFLGIDHEVGIVETAPIKPAY